MPDFGDAFSGMAADRKLTHEELVLLRDCFNFIYSGQSGSIFCDFFCRFEPNG